MSSRLTLSPVRPSCVYSMIQPTDLECAPRKTTGRPAASVAQRNAVTSRCGTVTSPQPVPVGTGRTGQRMRSRVMVCGVPSRMLFFVHLSMLTVSPLDTNRTLLLPEETCVT